MNGAVREARLRVYGCAFRDCALLISSRRPFTLLRIGPHSAPTDPPATDPVDATPAGRHDGFDRPNTRSPDTRVANATGPNATSQAAGDAAEVGCALESAELAVGDTKGADQVTSLPPGDAPDDPQLSIASPPSARATAATPDPKFLRLSLGFVYFHFGFLKFFPDLSPAELLATQTIMRMTGYRLDAVGALWWLAVMECAIGLCFLFNICARWVFVVFVFHQVSTFLPLVALPELTFKIAPFAPTLEGQYILKNLVYLAAGWTVLLPAVRSSGRSVNKHAHN